MDVFPDAPIFDASAFVKLRVPAAKLEKETLCKNCCAFECFISKKKNRVRYVLKSSEFEIYQNFAYTLNEALKAIDSKEKYKKNTWKQLEKRYKLCVNEENDEYAREDKKRQSVTLGFRWSNLFLVKALFTFGRRTVKPGEYHVIQTHNIGLFYYEQRKGILNDRDFDQTVLGWFRGYVIPPRSNFRIESGTQYVLITYEKTLFLFQRVKNEVELEGMRWIKNLKPLETSDSTVFKTPLPPSSIKKHAKSHHASSSKSASSHHASSSKSSRESSKRSSKSSHSSSPHFSSKSSRSSSKRSSKRSNSPDLSFLHLRDSVQPLDNFVRWSSRYVAPPTPKRPKMDDEQEEIPKIFPEMEMKSPHLFDPFLTPSFSITDPSTGKVHHWIVSRPDDSTPTDTLDFDTEDLASTFHLTEEMNVIFNQAEKVFAEPQSVTTQNGEPQNEEQTVTTQNLEPQTVTTCNEEQIVSSQNEEPQIVQNEELQTAQNEQILCEDFISDILNQKLYNSDNFNSILEDLYSSMPSSNTVHTNFQEDLMYLNNEDLIDLNNPEFNY